MREENLNLHEGIFSDWQLLLNSVSVSKATWTQGYDVLSIKLTTILRCRKIESKEKQPITFFIDQNNYESWVW